LNIIHARIQQLARAAQILLITGYRQVRQAVPNLSIGWRLGISFGAVAILAIAANLTVEHGASVIQTTKIFGPTPISRGQAPAARPVPLPAPIATAVAIPKTHLEDTDLLEALTQFDRSLLMRAQVPTSENNVLLATAAQQFAKDATSFASKATATAQPGPLKSFATHVRMLRAAADALVNANDARRAAFTTYWSHFEGIDRLTKSALDQNWTIFGRVIARQSLITLSRQLDDIRRRGAQLTAAGGHDPGTLSALSDGEASFLNALEKNAAGLTRSQGTRWVEQLRNELAGMSSSRTEFESADHQATASFSAFEQDVNSVAMLVRTVAAQSQKSGVVNKPVIAAPAAAAAAQSSTDSAAPKSTSAPLSPVRIYTHRTSSDFSPLARATIAVISSAVLVLLLSVSITTVRSIVLPIRQFMATTARLAGGDTAARFERGGIREIDSLAVSLNEMAATLETAQAITREYQGVLEVRIEERTRQLQHLAEHDLLTGLPNRRRLVSHLEESLQQSAGAPVAVFFLDLDNFKNFNDSMGHTAGDRVLQAVARRLAVLTAPNSFAARLGGDEFGVVNSKCGSIEQVVQYGNTLVDAFHSPLLVEGRELLVTVSVGVSAYPVHETSAEALLSAADAALFQAKHLGRNQLSLFSRDLLTTVSEKFNTEQALRRAVERNEFELVFQPEVSFDLGGIKLVEALLRWRLPDGRRVSPMQFLPTAQEFGLITEIGDWVLQSAIEATAKWLHSSWPDARVAINVSASQLLSKDFAQRLQQLLLNHNVPPRCIEIELTETILQTGPAIIDTLRELRELNIAVALDDFGTGFSSLASLQHLPLTRVKLDQSLIAAIDRDPRALAIARAIIGLCETLGLELTAEGVERLEQLGLLLEHPSTCLQGYLLSYPLESDSVPAAVANMPEQMQLLSLAALGSAHSKPAIARVAATSVRRHVMS
jgi:diguanylate cyclase (GGDEF)-like protein